MTKCKKAMERAQTVELMIQGMAYNAYGLRWDEEEERFVSDEYGDPEDEARLYRMEIYNKAVEALLKLI